MANLGFVGLGTMGGHMASRLLSKGHSVTGCNRTRSKAQWLIDKGMRWADSPRTIAAAADVTFTMVTNSAASTGSFLRSGRTSYEDGSDARANSIFSNYWDDMTVPTEKSVAETTLRSGFDIRFRLILVQVMLPSSLAAKPWDQ